MATTDDTAATAQTRLEELRHEFQKLVHQETTLRGARDAAVHAARNQNIPVSHLAHEAGVSREILHRILRTQPHTATPATSKTAAIQQLKTTQTELTKNLTQKSTLQKKRAHLIRETIQTTALPKSAIAHAAGISTETIRKTYQPK